MQFGVFVGRPAYSLRTIKLRYRLVVDLFPIDFRFATVYVRSSVVFRRSVLGRLPSRAPEVEGTEADYQSSDHSTHAYACFCGCTETGFG
jgi:hypothetical protein